MKHFEDIELQELEINVPDWIEQDITAGQVRSILQGGCASGAYMPAVTYHAALKTMSEHGDEVLESLEGNIELGADFLGQSWAGMACYLLSAAVEFWAASIEEKINSAERDHDLRGEK